MSEMAVRPSARRWLVAGAITAVLSLMVGSFALAPSTSDASSHREAPLVSADPQVDATDFYAFRSPDDPDTITFVSSWIPFEEPAGGPNFYNWGEGVRYDIKISNDADAKEEITYRWTFKTKYQAPTTNFLYNDGAVTSLTDPNLLIRQTYDLSLIKGGNATKLVNDGAVAPSHVGEQSMPDYEALSNSAIKTLSTGGKTWVGQSDDPFFLDLRVFNLLYGADFGAQTGQAGDDTLRGFNVNTMAIQVPMDQLAKGGDADTNPVIGAWTTAARKGTVITNNDGSQQREGKYVQVSRLGMPLVNEVVVPVGLKDYFNGSQPKKDEQYLGAVQDPILPHIVEAVYQVPVPDSDPDAAGVQRSDLISVFLTGLAGLNMPAGVEPAEMLRLNMTTPLCAEGPCAEHSLFGVIAGDAQGFPNGRRLEDDVIDIALRVVEGVLIEGHPTAVESLSDGVQANDVAFRSVFPFVALPHAGSLANPH